MWTQLAPQTQNRKPTSERAEGSVFSVLFSNRFVCQSASMMPSCDRFLPVADCFLPVAASSVCDGEINGFGNETPHKNCHSALAAGSADCIPTAGPQDGFRPTMFCRLAWKDSQLLYAEYAFDATPR